MCKFPVPHTGPLRPRKRWVAHYTEGLVRTMPSLLLLIDCCVHNKRVNELNSAVGGKIKLKLILYSENMSTFVSVRMSVCLSISSQDMKTN
jgi:hypothetical protein